MDRTTAMQVLWPQSGAAIDMLANAIELCPEDLWPDPSCKAEFGHLSFHTLLRRPLDAAPRWVGRAPDAAIGGRP